MKAPHLCCSCPSRASHFSRMALSLKFKCLFLKGPDPSSESRLVTAPREWMGLSSTLPVSPALALTSLNSLLTGLCPPDWS